MSGSNDGYSSDEDGPTTIPTKSSVTLGFVDTEIGPEEDELPTIEDTFIGGKPVWLSTESTPDEDLIHCKVCKGPTALLLQAFAPLEGTFYDRVIYVFACQKIHCSRAVGGIRAIRGVKKDPKKIAQLQKEEEEELKAQLDEKLKLDNARNFLFDDNKKKDASSNPFGSSSSTSNPFASSSSTTTSSNPFASSTATTTTSSPFDSNPFDKKKDSKPTFSSIAAKAAPPKPAPKKKAPSSNEQSPELPGYFLYVDTEKFNKKPQSKKIPDNVKISDTVTEEDFLSTATFDEKNSDPSPETQAVSAGLQDQVFQHFSEIAEYNPLQVLRYDLGGKPLLYSGKDDVAPKVVNDLVPRPAYNPSSTRQFELQIMPKAIMDFEKDAVTIDGGMQWGTIMVYTDVEDYVPELDKNHVGYVEEWVGVQYEEARGKRRS